MDLLLCVAVILSMLTSKSLSVWFGVFFIANRNVATGLIQCVAFNSLTKPCRRKCGSCLFRKFTTNTSCIQHFFNYRWNSLPNTFLSDLWRKQRVLQPKVSQNQAFSEPCCPSSVSGERDTMELLLHQKWEQHHYIWRKVYGLQRNRRHRSL